MIFPHRGGNCAVNCRGLICRQRFCDCVAANNLFFFLRRKKKREKERPLRGLRRADLAFPSEGKVPEGRMRCSAPARLCRQMLHFASLTEILSLRYRLSVFLSRRKKNSEKERPLRGFRREVRFIMSPPGKRRHNELNAAPPPETPRRTGKPGEPNNRDVVHSGESFCVRGKSRSFSLPLRGEGVGVADG